MLAARCYCYNRTATSIVAIGKGAYWEVQCRYLQVKCGASVALFILLMTCAWAQLTFGSSSQQKIHLAYWDALSKRERNQDTPELE